jgi:hypothetical protein
LLVDYDSIPHSIDPAMDGIVVGCSPRSDDPL